MEVIDPRFMNQEIQDLIKNKVQVQCFLCMGQFDCEEYAPMMMCMNQHSCCAPCLKELLKNQSKQVLCPNCNQPLLKKAIVKNRLLLTIYQIVTAYKSYVSQLQAQLETLRKAVSIDSKTSLLSKNPRMVSSYILPQQNYGISAKVSTFFDDKSTTKSQTWIGSTEKRRQLVLAYAQRQKIEQLQQISKSDMPFDQVMKIRSGYGTIKKIQCMEYFPNLRQLMLYNNHIKVIEGLSNNLKLNVLSLAYNKIEKVENLGHLKQLKRLSLECNKLGRSSAEYMADYQWKNLESLTISFHQQKKQDNEACLILLLSGKGQQQWGSLKTLYLYNSKTLCQKTKSMVKEIMSKRKSTVQIYWS